MPLYSYQAMDLDSATVRGQLDAADEAALSLALRQTGLFLTKCRELRGREQAGCKLKAMQLAEFSRQISTMLSSGVTLVRAVGILLSADLKPAVRAVYTELQKQLQQGRTLSDAMSSQGKAFPELMVNMYRAGEASGQLDKSAAKMAVFYEKEHRMNNKVRSASLYPLILLGVAVVVIIIIFTAVLPVLYPLFEGMELPFTTKVVMGVSDFLVQKWYIALACAAAVAGLTGTILQIPRVRRGYDHMKVTLPLVGKLMKIIYTARFSRTLSSLYVSGLSMINALNITAQTMGNTYLTAQFPDIVKKVRNGDMLSRAVLPVGGFDPKLAPTIFVGEETGKLEDMLESIADSYDYESEIAVQKLVAIMEPMLIILMAVVIGFIMLSVMLPIWQLYNNIG